MLHTQRNDYKVYIKKEKSKMFALFKLTVERRLKLDKPTIAIFCVLVNVSSGGNLGLFCDPILRCPEN